MALPRIDAAPYLAPALKPRDNLFYARQYTRVAQTENA